MAKNYHLNRKPYDYSLFTQGVDDSGKAIQEAYTPATDQQISKFEADYESVSYTHLTLPTICSV